MALRMISRLGIKAYSAPENVRYISITAAAARDNNAEWRYQRGLPRNPNSYGPLTDSRDFSFVDGRPVPLGVGQQTRQEKHAAYAEKIVQVVKEMDFAVERHARVVREEAERRQAILDSKLKPKGHLMLQKKTKNV